MQAHPRTQLPKVVSWRTPKRTRRLIGALLLVLIACLATITSSASIPAAAQDVATPQNPLTMSLDSLSPATVPQRGPIEMTGRLSNPTAETWQSVAIYPFVSSSPITTRAELDDASDTDITAVVGSRITSNDVVQRIGELEPGAEVRFSLRVPRRLLNISEEPGVYWIGAHALGTNTRGADVIADGRARTFIPLMTKDALDQREDVDQTRSVPVALTLPIRHRTTRTPSGRLANPELWASTLQSGGRLAELLRFADSAPDESLNLVIDPAVFDAMRSLVTGNLPTFLGDETGPVQEIPDQADPSPAGTSEADLGDAVPSEADTDDVNLDRASPNVSEAVSDAAATWDRRALRLTTRQPTFYLPYADPDLDALLRWSPQLLEAAVAMSESSNERTGLEAELLLAPADGHLNPTLVNSLPKDADLLLSDQPQSATPGPDLANKSGTTTYYDHDLATQAPAPAEADSPLALRQQLLAMAAVSYLNDNELPPLVASLPAFWDPGFDWEKADFFDWVDEEWIAPAKLPQSGTEPRQLNVGLSAKPSREIPRRNILAADQLASTGKRLTQLLSQPSDAGAIATNSALDSISYAARKDPAASRGRAERAASYIEDLFSAVEIQGNSFVTLSSGSGTFTVSMINDLDYPITVGLEPITTSDRVKVKVPDPVRLGPGKRASVSVSVDISAVGVQEIGLVAVTKKGSRVGQPFTFSLRTSQVGELIWYIMGAGGLLLAVMILRRVFRWLRRRTPGATDADPETSEPETGRSAGSTHG